ncbi:hypothetical protein ACO0LM_12240 [Undibacterium sp. Di26W]|uniref:hypothetical protein n=1 Tax=Undibacterium sp. Di26W TaxID=3413035 RepID=UPI003BF3284F
MKNQKEIVAHFFMIFHSRHQDGAEISHDHRITGQLLHRGLLPASRNSSIHRRQMHGYIQRVTIVTGCMNSAGQIHAWN